MGEGPQKQKQKDRGLIHAKCDSATNKNNQCRPKSLTTDTVFSDSLGMFQMVKFKCTVLITGRKNKEADYQIRTKIKEMNIT